MIRLATCVAVLSGLQSPIDVSAQELDLDSAARRAIFAPSRDRREAIQWLIQNGDLGSVAVMIQLLRTRPDEEAELRAQLMTLTGADPGPNWYDWMIWQQRHPEIRPYPGYQAFLADYLASIDPRFRRFLEPRGAPQIRVEEIVWGGVSVDGIPALDFPKMIRGEAADYLDPDDEVFGVEINGDARAYPLRIVNWHEMVNDRVGGASVSLAYCTLCGAGVLFEGRVAGQREAFTFGSSGLLHRSNKLMYDRQTNTLWSQFTGRPVLGSLAGSGLSLKVLPLVLTRWKEWLAIHPKTLVLTLQTGFDRDYGAGVAYGDYFASADLRFPAISTDPQFSAKEQVFGVRVPGGAKAWPLAELAKNAVLNDRVGLLDVVVIRDGSGRGARAYGADGRVFSRSSDDVETLAAQDGRWRITEAALLGPDGRSLLRLPGHVSYWFAWTGAFEEAAMENGP